MTMNRTAIIATFLSAAVAASASAKEPAGWARVPTLKPGTMIVVTVRDSDPVKRRFVMADDATLAIGEGENPKVTETILKTDIVEIKAPKHRGTGRKVALGAAGYFLGGIAGGMLGMYTTRSFSGIVGMFPGAAVGILVGVRGGFHRPYEVIYSQ
jgi:hypothetical protein